MPCSVRPREAAYAYLVCEESGGSLPSTIDTAFTATEQIPTASDTVYGKKDRPPSVLRKTQRRRCRLPPRPGITTAAPEHPAPPQNTPLWSRGRVRGVVGGHEGEMSLKPGAPAHSSLRFDPRVTTPTPDPSRKSESKSTGVTIG